MVKRKVQSNPTLDGYRDKWRKSHSNILLSKAVRLCQVRRLPLPEWLCDAIDEQLTKKAGRSTDVIRDHELYNSVQDCLDAGHSQEEAFSLVAQRYGLKTKDGEDADYTVRSAWLRHKKRIEPDPAPFDLDHPWRIKDEFLEADKKVQEMRSSNAPIELGEALTPDEEEALDNMSNPDWVNEFFRLLKPTPRQTSLKDYVDDCRRLALALKNKQRSLK